MQENKNTLLPLFIIGVLFFTFGFITWTNGTLIPFLKIACELESDTQAFLVTSAFYMSYFFLAIPSSIILNKVGFKNGMVIGLIIVAIGSLIFIPASNQRQFSLFLTGLFVQGMGLALLQTAVNPYVSILGPIESAAKRISMMGIANKIAGILAPIILGGIVLSGVSDIETKLKNTTSETEKAALLDNLVSRINTPYIFLAIFLVFVAVFVWLSKLPEVKEDSDEVSSEKTKKENIFEFPNLILGVFTIIFYVAAEVIAGDGIGQYGKNIGISLDEAKNFTAYTLGSMLVGYVIGIIAIPKYIKQENALKYSAILGIIFTIAAIFTSGYTSVYCIALMGLSNALMWPAIFPMAIKGLGKFTKLGSALLIMGIGPGGGLIPLAYTAIGGETNPQRGFWVMAVCYLFILYFATVGHKKKNW